LSIGKVFLTLIPPLGWIAPLTLGNGSANVMADILAPLATP
jgi:hypothetical protein